MDSSRYRHHDTGHKSLSSSTIEVLDLDIDTSSCGEMCLPLWESDKKSYVPLMTLYKYNEIPDFMKGNAYIINGYRGEMNFNFCVKRYF